MKTTAAISIVVAFGIWGCSTADRSAHEMLTFHGASDASAAISVGDNVVVADDESNTLRVYGTAGGLPVSSLDMSEALAVDAKFPEADIEGAAAVGDRIYWITSHGRNKHGELRSSRFRFFATDVKTQGGAVLLEPVGEPYSTLAQEMVNASPMRGLRLEEATRFDAVDLGPEEVLELAPKKRGLNIEGLCAAADGSELFIGLRNPRPVDPATGRARAIVARLENAAAVIEQQAAPIFAEPMLWDLDGMGVRSMDYSERHAAYFIVAGGPGDGQAFATYRWSGGVDEPPIREDEIDYGDLHPEALAQRAGAGALLVLSDDGSLTAEVSSPTECMKSHPDGHGFCLNKFLTNPERKMFRGALLYP